MEERILQALEGLNKRFDSLEVQVRENTDILKALEHSAQVNKAEHDKIFVSLAEINGNVKNIQKDLSTVEVVTASNWSDLAKLKAIK